MSNQLREYVEAAVQRIIEVHASIIRVLNETPKVDQTQLKLARAALEDLKSLVPPSAPRASEAWAARSRALRPYLAEYSDEPPRQVDYAELTELTGLSEKTIRIRISQSMHKGFARYVRGRYVVVLRDPTLLTKILDLKFSQTQNPDDRISLPRRAARSTL